MKRRSQTQAQRAREPEKKTKEKSGALTLSQFSSDVIWQVSDALFKRLRRVNKIFIRFLAGIAILVTRIEGAAFAVQCGNHWAHLRRRNEWKGQCTPDQHARVQPVPGAVFVATLSAGQSHPRPPYVHCHNDKWEVSWTRWSVERVRAIAGAVSCILSPCARVLPPW